MPPVLAMHPPGRQVTAQQRARQSTSHDTAMGLQWKEKPVAAPTVQPGAQPVAVVWRGCEAGCER